MGQTLTHGIYLPDEGERNCYNGLAANWQLLDGAVGTVAEHTSQIAGKAPLVHTHTKADITDFPAYGNTAGTICEGNDSRLSDARTPVAHTHGKADITNLFNSANTWTANNYFPLTLSQKGFSPRASTPVSNEFGQYSMVDANNSPLMSINSANRATGVRDLTFRVYTNDGNANGVGVFKDAINSYSFCSLDPNNTINLGTSTNKWKTLNGVNPGALSLPDGGASNADTTFNPDLTDWLMDGTPFTINAQVTGWLHIRIKNSTGNFAWVKRGSAGANQTWGIVGNSDTNSDIADIPLNVPVIQNYAYTLKIKSSTVYAAIFLCLGNV